MRLGQLARKLDTKPAELKKLIDEHFKVELGAHPNIKLKEEYVKFAEETLTVASEETQEGEMDEATPLTEKTAKKESKSETKSDDLDPFTPRPVPANLDNVEHIETQRLISTQKFTVIGKVDVPLTGPDMVDVDGVLVDRDEAEEKVKEEKRLKQEAILKAKQEEKEARELAREEKRKKIELEKHLALQKKKEKEAKIEAEKLRKQKEYEEEKRKEHYKKIQTGLPAKAPVKKKKIAPLEAKPEKVVAPEPTPVVAEKPSTIERAEEKPTKAPEGSGMLAKFWFWLNNG